MLIQFQEEGSYRSADVVAALEWMLPSARDATDSTIVVLDWHAGHRTQEVVIDLALAFASNACFTRWAPMQVCSQRMSETLLR